MFKRTWKGLPGGVRKPVVVTLGLFFIVLGLALVVVPGPFTVPPILLGMAILSTEFPWAKRELHRFQEVMKRLQAKLLRMLRRKRNS